MVWRVWCCARGVDAWRIVEQLAAKTKHIRQTVSGFRSNYQASAIGAIRIVVKVSMF